LEAEVPMKALALSIVVVAAAAIASPAAAAQPRRMFLRVQGGLDAVETPLVEGVDRYAGTVGAGLEYRHTRTFGVVTQVQYGRQGADRSVFDITGPGPWTLRATTALRVVAFGADARATPYVTAGIGVIQAHWPSSVFRTSRQPRTHETALAVPLGLGLTCRLGGRAAPALYAEITRELTNTSVVFPHGLATHGLRIGVLAGL
jgi:opacity protein-like surface antigen